MKQYNITLLKGDGIGPEITDSVVEILSKANGGNKNNLNGGILYYLLILS